VKTLAPSEAGTFMLLARGERKLNDQEAGAVAHVCAHQGGAA
jgi:hypothetical protein